MTKQNNKNGNADSETGKINWKNMDEMNPEFREKVTKKDTDGDIVAINADELKNLKAKLALYETREAAANAETDLTVDEIVTLGGYIQESVRALRVMNSAIEFIPEASSLSTDEFTVNYFRVYDLTDSMFEQIRDIISTLDEAAYTLLENDEANELQDGRDNKFI